MARALGIISFSENHIWVEGLETYRSIPAFSFLGRYRVVDFPISNMSNSGIDRIQVYIRRKPCSLVEHIGTGRHPLLLGLETLLLAHLCFLGS